MGQHVLVAVDGSDQAERAFEYAVEHLKEPRLTLVNVVNPASVFGYAEEDDFDLEGYNRETQRRKERAAELLADYQDRAESEGLDVETAVRSGRPARQILRAVEEGGIDHVVMGSHGRSGVGRVVFGSVAETVTRRSPVPVTIVR